MNTTTTWTTTISRSAEDVFARLSDIERHPEWSPYAFRAEKASDGPIGVGTEYRTYGWLPGKGKDYLNEVRITAYEPGKRFAFDAKDPAGPVIPSEFVLTAQGGDTRVERTMTMPRPDGFQGILWPVIFPMLVKPAIQKNFNLLKKRLEEEGSTG